MVGKKTIGLAVLAILVLALFMVSGCTQKISVEEAEQQVADAKQAQIVEFQKQMEELQTSIDSQITDLKAEKEATEQLLVAEEANNEEIQKELEVLEAQLEQLETEAETVSDICLMIEEYKLNSQNIKQTMDDNDVPTLLDTSVEFDGSSYDVHEELILSDEVKILTSEDGDEDFADMPYLVMEADGAIKYNYVFDESIVIDDIKSDETLEITFLGKEIEISDVDKSGNDMTIISGQTFSMSEGEIAELTIGDEIVNVEVLTISDGMGEVKFFIDGVDGGISKVMKAEKSDKIGEFSIYVEEVLPNEVGETVDDLVVFRLARGDVETTVDNGDYYDEDVELWRWNIEVKKGELKSLSLTLDERFYKVDDETPALAIGEYLSLPEEYLSIGIVEVTNLDAEEIMFSFDDSYGDADEPVILIETKGESLMIKNDEVSEVGYNGTRFIYKDEDGDWKDATKLKYSFDDITRVIKINMSDNTLTFGEIVLSINITDSKFGVEKEEAEADELLINGKPFGLRDTDVLTTKGFIVKSPEDGLEEDEVSILVPSDVVEAVLCVR